MTDTKERPSRTILRSRIEKQLKRQQEEQRKELLRRRIDIAKEGVQLAQAGKTVESVRKYQQYILILEMWKKAGKDGLTLNHFDRSKDLYEIVLLSGIFWDLAKLYDKAKNASQLKEMNTYLKKYLIFSKGMPFQPLSAEALRKYLGSGRCKHRAEFKAIYTSLSGEKCFIATSLLDVTHPDTLLRLRRFRDEKLRLSSPGRRLVYFYYRASPTLVRLLDASPQQLRRLMGKFLDRAAQWLVRN
ncbi:MAG: hypothetical protein H7301_06120 [Cryobacterium sp.]|nr:hypothetical protein [Oligoflexia bacterium]